MFGNNYNPYLYTKKGLLSSITNKWDWGTILGNTQKTLGIINQAIPIMYQIKPILGNAKTIFRIMGALKEDEKSSSNISQATTNTKEKNLPQTIKHNYSSEEGPQFFL